METNKGGYSNFISTHFQCTVMCNITQKIGWKLYVQWVMHSAGLCVFFFCSCHFALVTFSYCI